MKEQTVLEALKISESDSNKDEKTLKKILKKCKSKADVLNELSFLDIPEKRKLYMAFCSGGFIEKEVTGDIFACDKCKATYATAEAAKSCEGSH